ncbi:peptide ABC transporter substrate-binding protein [Streptomyces abyssomicinicus]|uniref:peptide ABC transporter substrate-binding protein n=1 Tax=Streptomyces abyssomicinicus TaxID=574929 RepID=UPI0012509443|nr:ABC transporter substrate-binding protein [Streptomyces abyssomicinicus]
MRGAKSAKWLAGAIVVALAATACSSGEKDDKAAAGDSKRYVSINVGEPQKGIIPSDTNESNGSYIVDAVFAGLLTFDDKGGIEYLNAESVTTEDSKLWTVKLKEGWKFHDGTPVTAKSYVDAWNWSAHVDNVQQNSFWFGDIAGYDDVHPAKEGAKAKADTMSGLKVVDDTTFTIELKEAMPFYQYKIGYSTFAPLPEAFFKDPKAFSEKPIGNGPYEFEKWDHNKVIKVKAYGEYKGANKAKNAGVEYKTYETPEAAYQDLMSGNLDIIDQVGPTDLANYESDLGDRAISQSYAAVQTLTPAFYSKSFKDIDVKVLQGLSMAIDRETITKTVLQGTRTPADGFVAPGAQGKQTLDTDVFKFDAAKAKQLIEDGGGVPGNKIFIQYNTDGGHKEWVTAVCNSITKATGVECEGDAKPDFATDLEARDNDQVKSFYRGGWVGDYPLNGNFIKELYHSQAESNNGHFEDKKLDDAMNKADASKTLEEYVAAYQEVEKELVNHMPSIPLWFYEMNGGHGEEVDNVHVDWHGQYKLFDVTVK